MAPNLYVHFPFCRRKCSYCSLYSRCGTTAEVRAAYVATLARTLTDLKRRGEAPDGGFATVYFGGGTPALCDLRPILGVLQNGLLGSDAEFTVELHPDDVSDDLLRQLRDGGVNRISMGVQSLDDDILAHMGRGYTVAAAARAFARIRAVFDNAGIDLIVGYPGDDKGEREGPALGDWGLTHASVYALQNERGLAGVPDDEWTMDRLRTVGESLAAIGLERYEISNYALPGCACRHNLAVWNGEDYLGLGEGACGRLGLTRTRNMGFNEQVETVSPEADEKERRFFRLRTRDGLSTAGHPDWTQKLMPSVREGLLAKDGDTFRLTPRGSEVCDAILADLV